MEGVGASSMSPTLDFIEHYSDCLEILPHDIQRYISQLRELDLVNEAKLQQVGRFMVLYKRELNVAKRRKWLNKIQKCLVRSQQCGDEKLVLINQISEMIEARAGQISRDAEKMELLKKDGVANGGNVSNGNGNGSRSKVEKKATSSDERLAKVLYEKPRRMRRVRMLEKAPEIPEKILKTVPAAVKLPPSKDVEREEQSDNRNAKDTVRKEKEKERDKEKDVREKDEKEEKKPEKRDVRPGKLAKKIAGKPNGKLKKQKKKEKDSVADEMVIDPDEPTYCLCNRVSFGDMIGCDNEDCAIEWFHFACVNLTNKPKGKWFCPGCTSERKDKGKKT